MAQPQDAPNADLLVKVETLKVAVQWAAQIQDKANQVTDKSLQSLEARFEARLDANDIRVRALEISNARILTGVFVFCFFWPAVWGIVFWYLTKR